MGLWIFKFTTYSKITVYVSQMRSSQTGKKNDIAHRILDNLNPFIHNCLVRFINRVPRLDLGKESRVRTQMIPVYNGLVIAA